MTMTRKTKSEHQAVIASAGRRGYTEVTFASPRLIMAARADRGHAYMSRREYIAHRMHRTAFEPSMIEEKRRDVASVKRRQRTLGGRRVTGYKPGTKRPVTWTSYSVERCVHRAPLAYALAA
jgi:hypothetical protein